MKIQTLRSGLWCLAAALICNGAHADGSKPNCKQAPERRDCVKVEDPDATAPAPSVHRKPKPPGAMPRPLPAAGGAKAR